MNHTYRHITYPNVLFKTILGYDAQTDHGIYEEYALENFNRLYFVFIHFVDQHPMLPKSILALAIDTHVLLQTYMHLFTVIYERESRCILIFDRFNKLLELFEDYVTDDPAQRVLSEGGIRLSLEELKTIVLDLINTEPKPEIPCQPFGPGRVITQSE